MFIKNIIKKTKQTRHMDLCNTNAKQGVTIEEVKMRNQLFCGI